MVTNTHNTTCTRPMTAAPITSTQHTRIFLCFPHISRQKSIAHWLPEQRPNEISLQTRLRALAARRPPRHILIYYSLGTSHISFGSRLSCLESYFTVPFLDEHTVGEEEGERCLCNFRINTAKDFPPIVVVRDWQHGRPLINRRPTFTCAITRN